MREKGLLQDFLRGERCLYGAGEGEQWAVGCVGCELVEFRVASHLYMAWRWGFELTLEVRLRYNTFNTPGGLRRGGESGYSWHTHPYIQHMQTCTRASVGG